MFAVTFCSLITCSDNLHFKKQTFRHRSYYSLQKEVRSHLSVPLNHVCVERFLCAQDGRVCDRL